MKTSQPLFSFFAFVFFSSLVLVSKAESAESESSTNLGSGVEKTAVDQNRGREAEESPSQTNQYDGEGGEDNCD